jgi:hypothetical protein
MYPILVTVLSIFAAAGLVLGFFWKRGLFGNWKAFIVVGVAATAVLWMISSFSMLGILAGGGIIVLYIGLSALKIGKFSW